MSPAFLAATLHALVGLFLLPPTVAWPVFLGGLILARVLPRSPKLCIFLSYTLLALMVFRIPLGILPATLVFFDSFLLWVILSWENDRGDLPSFLKGLLRNSARLALVIGLLATLFFTLFPALPVRSLLSLQGGALVGLGSGREMIPGQNASIEPTARTAFIVKTGKPIPPGDLYWRAGTLTTTLDGMHWFHPKSVRNLSNHPSKERVQKFILFEHRAEVPLGLDSPSRIDVVSENLILAGSPGDVSDLPGPDLIESRPLPRNDADLSSLLDGVGIRSGEDPLRVRDRILDWFRRDFSYTLSPGTLPHPRLRSFLLSKKAGYCEHYAAAFSSLMRLASIPSRVVIGYRGGVWNAVSGSYRVGERDAHAWSEFWLERERRWIRVDPTEIVPGAPARDSTHELHPALEMIDVVLAEIRLFMEESPGIALLCGLGVLFGVLSAFLALFRKKSTPDEIVLDTYRGVCKRAAVAGVTRVPSEGPLLYGTRLEAAFPDQSHAIRAFFEEFIRLRYTAPPTSLEGCRTLRKAGSRIRFRASTDPDSGFQPSVGTPRSR